MKIVRLILLGLWLSACSTKIYQDTTARYNAYFLAELKMQEAEKQLFDNRKDNYHRILHVIPTLDTNQLKSVKALMEDCIKKAAFLIQRHPTSKWAPESYVIVGKARFYQNDYANAIETFKYVNTKSEVQDSRHRAMIELMRTFIADEKMQEAEVVKNYLRKQKMSKNNMGDYYVMQAHYYRKKEDFERTKKSLELAMPILKKGEHKARLHYLLGQIYTQEKNYEQAYKNFNKVLKNNPPYELYLQAQLGKMQATDLENTAYKSLENKYKKMLKDLKNKEYRDKIYYELSSLEMKRKKLNQSIEYLKESVQVSEGNEAQKGYSFLRLGEIHFDQLQKYTLAKSYYDSTILFLPKDEKNYKKIANRQEVLDEFVQQISTIQMEDSLQRLSKMDESEREQYLEKTINEQVRDEVEFEKKRQEALKNKQNQQNGTLDQAIQTNKGSWYFDNLNAVSQGRIAFFKKWGQRPLADFWLINSLIDLNTAENKEIEEVDAEAEEQKLIQERVSALKKELLEKMPKNADDIEKSNQKIEEAIYTLGKIYHLKLEEYEDAIKTYKKLIKRFPETKYEAETLYLLFLSYQATENETLQDEYQDILLEKYPNSIYAKLIINPDFLTENKAKDQEAKAKYQKAYRNYEEKNYDEALDQLNQVKSNYPNTSIMDKIDFIRIKCIKELESKEIYIEHLEKYIQDHDQKELTEQVKLLLEKAKQS